MSSLATSTASEAASLEVTQENSMPPPPQTAPLLDLPLDILRQILQDCLLVDGVINLYPASYQSPNVFSGNKRPDIALFLVCKDIKSRAEHVFYGGNTFELNLDPFIHRELYSLDDIDIGIQTNEFWHSSMWDTHATKFRHILTRFDPADLSLSESRAIRKIYHEDILQSNYMPIRSRNMHDLLLQRCNTFSLCKVETIEFMEYLKTWTVDIENLYCPVGCCRRDAIDGLFSTIIGTLESWEPTAKEREERRHPRWNLPDVEIIYLGVENDEERQLLDEGFWITTHWTPFHMEEEDAV